jgi:hypothetical protein
MNKKEAIDLMVLTFQNQNMVMAKATKLSDEESAKVVAQAHDAVSFIMEYVYDALAAADVLKN